MVCSSTNAHCFERYYSILVIGRFNQPQKLGNRLPRYRVNDFPQISQLRFISSVYNDEKELRVCIDGISFPVTVLN